MNHVSIMAELDAGKIGKERAIDMLAETCPSTFLSALYLSCRAQRNDLIANAPDPDDDTSRPTLDASILLDLIDHALRTDYISAALAERWLTSIGLNADESKHHAETVVAIRDKTITRAAFLNGPDDAPRYCTRCGIKSKAERLSTRGICVECSAAAVEQSIEQLQSKKGPIYTKWRLNLFAALANLPDNLITATTGREPSTLGDFMDLNEPQNDDPIYSPF